MFDNVTFNECNVQPIYTYVLGIFLCLGGIISYFPQYYSLIKSKHSKGISELSLFILNIGSACLAANSFILNWFKFQCYSNCSFWLCTANLLSLFQIMVGWIVVFPLYLIFVRYKIKHSDARILNDIIYFVVYVIFILLMVIVGVFEKTRDNNEFFQISAYSLGIISMVCTCIVWLPQIIKLIRTKEQGNLSLLMFILQTPGNLIIIIFQLLYHQSITTWGTYVVSFIEQLIIVIILLILKCKSKREINESSEVEPIIEEIWKV